MKPPLPASEAARLTALRRYDILDTPPDQQLDDITLLASRICGTPIAMISLVDENRQWFKSRLGTTVSETPRDIAFCAHGILQAEVLVVNDALTDERFAHNPQVTSGQKIRFYAGAPLITSDGHALGMLCVNDQVPRELSEEQTTALLALGRQVVTQFELGRSLKELQDTVAQLRQTEDSLRLLGSALEQSKESIVITDARLDPPGPRIVFVNPAFTRMTGYSAAEAVGRTPRILQGPRTDKTVLKRLREDLRRGDVFAGEAINYRKDGTEFDLEWQIAPIRDRAGTTTHFVAIQRDITERKRLEAQAIQSQKMETVGKLAGGIAHEFNSILTAITGQSELLLSDLPGESPLTENAREICKAAKRAATLTRQLLAYGRKQFLRPQTLDLNAVLAGMEDTFRHLACGAAVEVRVLPAADLRPVKADPGQIEEAIVNLAMNAVDAMSGGGTLTLQTANVTLTEADTRGQPDWKAGDYALLSVSDTGSGMSEETKARAFDPFFTTRGIGQGTGLGLSTCYGIIKQSGGHISVSSELRRGTIFRIYLPLIAAGPVPVPTASSPLFRGTETVLFVEDEPALREIAVAWLRRLGYTVLSAIDGEDALKLMHQRGPDPVDVLFTDVVMPRLNGIELASRLRSLFPDIRVLFTSAYNGDSDPDNSLQTDDAFLPKPFTPGDLAAKLREVLDASPVPAARE